MAALIPLQATADCKTDCNTALQAGDKLIQDLKSSNSIRQQIIEKQQTNLAYLSQANEEKQKALASWYHDPFIVGGIGISLGAIAVLLIKRK